MSVYQRGKTWWYKFYFAEKLIRESSKSPSKTLAKKAEKQRRKELEEGYNDLADNRDERVRTISTIADVYLENYKLRHSSGLFAECALGHVKKFFGRLMQVDISDGTVKEYQTARLKGKASPKTINEEIGFLLRMLGERGDAIRGKMRREKTLKLKVRQNVGKAYDPKQKSALLQAARVGSLPLGEDPKRKLAGTRSPFIQPALALAFNAGLRDAEIRNLTWQQIDLEKRFLTVGRSKTDAGEGRTIPLNAQLLSAVTEYASWYTQRFGISKPEWYVFPGRVGTPETGKKRPYDPTRPVSSLKTSWKNVKDRAGVQGRFHDTRHTLITELAEGGAGDQTIMDTAGHVSRQMLARYSHIRMEAKRKALEGIGAKPSVVLATNEVELGAHASTTAESKTAGAQKWAQ
jgi:integrase